MGHQILLILLSRRKNPNISQVAGHLDILICRFIPVIQWGQGLLSDYSFTLSCVF